MSEMDRHGMTEKDRRLLFWASFLSLMAAGMAFAFRAMVPDLWGAEYNVLKTEVGELFGAGLWPIAITMILFSFIVDKVGYKLSMMCAFLLQGVSVVLTLTASSYDSMWWACFFAGLGHGVVEAVINPLVASVYRHEKTKWLAIVHAAWPAGIAAGAAIYMLAFKGAETWDAAKVAWIVALVPVVAYGVMYFMCKVFPVDERVEAKVPYIDMLKEMGGLGAFLAISFIGYEVYGRMGLFADGQYTRLLASLTIGVVGGAAFGFAVKAVGRWMFFFLCVLMVPLATAELATDAWIQNLMKPTLGEYAGWALVFSASIMMFLRFFVDVPLKLARGPIGLLLISSVFSIIGLFWLSVASGILVWIAFIFYAVGQTFYWPGVLGLTSERYPKGGALTLNTVSAIGLLTVGVFGGPFLGAAFDSHNANAIIEDHAALVQTIETEGRTSGDNEDLIVQDKNLFGVSYTGINADAVMTQPEFPVAAKDALQAKLDQSGRKTLRTAASLPISMAIGFFLMLLWFKAHGGYKPIVLVADDAEKTV